MSNNNNVNVILTEEEYDKALKLLEATANYMRSSKNPEWTITGTVGDVMNILLDAYDRTNSAE